MEKSVVYNVVKGFVRLCLKKPEVFGEENYQDTKPAIFMCNHENLFGPLVTATRFPIIARQWANSMVTEIDVCKKYIAETFFMDTLGLREGISRALGNAVGGIVSWAVRNTNPIISYWDAGRAPKSIQNGLNTIEKGENQIIFAKTCNVFDKEFEFMQGYLLLSKLAIQKLNICPNIYPVSINKVESTIAIAPPTSINIENKWTDEKDRINSYVVNRVRQTYSSPKLVYDNSINI